MSGPVDRIDELGQLSAALCDGEATADEALRLEKRLTESASARQFFLEYVQLHLGLVRKNFDGVQEARPAGLARHFADAEHECSALLDRHLALPAYDQCIKASHLFNLMDARGAIAVTGTA